MRFKKAKAVVFALMIALSTASLGGCSFFGNNQDAPIEEESSESENTTEDNDDETTEEDDDEEAWIPNVDLIHKTDPNPETSEPITEIPEEVCVCQELCKSNEINKECEVCKLDFHKCKGQPVADPLDAFALPDGQTGTVSIIAVGSNFYNTAVMNGTDKSYNYDYIYENIKEVLKNYDVKIVTQEGIFTNDPSKYSGVSPYKLPPSIANSLVNAGFNVVASATDHAFDNGKEGIVETLNAWAPYSNSTLVTGIYTSEAAYNNICLADINGIRIAFLNYTSSLNGTTLTNDEKTFVKTLYNEDVVADEIKYASKHADFVIVMPHWGNEDARTHSQNQEKWVQVFIENGADLIIGTGSDVIQEVNLYKNSKDEIIPCYYSLGNFVSPKESPDEVLSGAAVLTISKTGKVTTLEKYDMLPLSLHVSKKGDFFKSYLLDEYPEDTIKWHNLIQNGQDLSLDGMKTQFSDTVEIMDLNNFGQEDAPGGLAPVYIQQDIYIEGAEPETVVETENDNNGNPLVEDGVNNVIGEPTSDIPTGGSPFGGGVTGGLQPIGG